MENLLIILFLAIIGVQLGSFAGASVWRLRARQLAEDKVDGEAYDKKEYNHLKKVARSEDDERPFSLSAL